MMWFSTVVCFNALILPAFAQLSNTVGPTTTRAEKSAVKICNVLNYGGVASLTSDIGPPLAAAFAACISGGTVYVPPGNYGLETWVTLTGGSSWALQLDGIIYRTGTADSGGNMIFIEHATDFEMYSSTSKGAIQGYGYVYHAAGTYGPRILRLYEVVNFSVHDIALVDAGAFHFVMDTCTSGEIYNMVIHGGSEGGLDGIDVWGDNIYIHDIEVSNKDECVTVKSPATNMLIENIFCNWSGGCAVGSLGADTVIKHISYNNIYTWESNQMLLIKSNGGDGLMETCSFTNFMGHENAYMLDIDTSWSGQTAVAGDGITFTGLTFSSWSGTAASGVSRAPIQILCPADVPCTDITLTNVDLWTDDGTSELYKCANAWGTGGCLNSGTAHTAYSVITSTIKTAPAGYSATTMPGQLATGLPLTTVIPIPTIPTSFFPGATPASKLLG